ncbi:Mth938-like domain-containing protein [Dissulfurispira sp.]|uniref:Mth938-like domain-containing protein n=1 Tax=Dissulfurispira sp. TaxID=2817609 RepID=UPI002FD98085
MKIQHYSFGRITIDGKTYTSDVIIYPDRVNSSWWRKEGHFLQMDDLREVLDARPEVIIIGTGYSGVMRVSDEVISNLKSMKIDVHVARTTDAVNLFNELSGKRKTIACLHLTC